MTERYEAELRAVVRAWDACPSGRWRADAVHGWLTRQLGPAVEQARAALGEPPRAEEEKHG